MTELDFSDITGGESSGSSSGGSSSNRTQAEQLHVKGRYGTTTFHNTDGCIVCGKNADAVLLIGVSADGDKGMRDGERLICDEHEGDVRGDLEYDQDRIVRKDF